MCSRPLRDESSRSPSSRINRPQEAFVELRSGWQRHALPCADFEWCCRLAKLIANSTQQRVDSTAPLLSASLPTGERRAGGAAARHFAWMRCHRDSPARRRGMEHR